MRATHRRWRLWPLAAAAIFFAAATGTTTEASGVGAMSTGGQTSQPIGHYEFCNVNPSECSIRLRDYGPVILSDELRGLVEEVNAAVNQAVKPLSDYDIYNKDEVWAYPDTMVGDCEDYVLEKRRQLAAEGISLSNLLITVVRKPDNEGHAVLTLRTDRGDFILDNLRDDMRPWYKTGYRFLKRQSATHTGRWVSLREDQNMLVGAVQ
jgi:predicted transglutaminase-like cysteine proteinase